MRISKLQIEDFGKFHRATLQCGPKINMLSGANESGKSTIRRFLRAMFFGLERERGIRAKTDDYTKYLPWEYGRFQGSIEFEVDGVSYRLFRNFLTSAKECHLTNLTTGREVPQPDAFLIKTGMISEQAFCNTLWVGNNCIAGEELAEELQNYLANLALTGGANVDVSLAISRLSEQKRDLQRNLPDQDIDEVKQRLYKEEFLQNQYHELLALRKDLEVKRHLNDTNQKLYQKEQERLFLLEHNKEELLSYLYDEKLSEVLPVSEWESTLKEQQTRAVFSKKRANQMLYLLAPGALCFLIALLLPVKSLSLAVAGGFAMLSSLLLFGFFRYQAKRFTKGAESWRKQISSQTTEFVHQRLRTTQEEVKRSMEAMQQQLPLIEKNNFELERCEEQLAELEYLKEQLADLQKRQQQIKTELKAIDLTVQSITNLSGKLYDEFGVKFGTALSEYASSFTDGAYQKLAADENLQLSALTPERTVAVSQVSYSTAEQFYLALRLAAADVFDPQKKLPLLLDDSFASFDEQRLESALVCLSNCGRQVFLFSSTGREERIAKRMGIAYEADFNNLRTNIEVLD